MRTSFSLTGFLCLFATVGALGVMGAPAAFAQCSPDAPCGDQPVDLGTLGGSFAQADALSSDGAVVVGTSRIAGDTAQHAFRWTSGSGMVDLGTLGGTNSSSSALSGDGAVVVGTSSIAGDTAQHAFRWTSFSGMVDLGTLGGTNSSANALSSDGTVVTGDSDIAGDAANHAFRWTTAGGMVDLGTLGGTDSYARALSSDGAVVVGYSETVGDVEEHAFRWTVAGGMVDLGTLGGAFSSADAVSSDGAVVIGDSWIAGDTAIHAFRWTEAGGMVDLGTLGGTHSFANDLSSDGAVVVGRARTTGNTETHAFRWTEAGGMVDLGTLGGTSSDATALSSDGAVVVGDSFIAGGAERHAFRWTEAGGIQDLNTLLSSAGVDMTGITLNFAHHVSANGQFIVGEGGSDLYIVRYDDGTGAGGLTTNEAVQASVNAAAQARLGLLAQHQGFAAPLLGADKPMVRGTEVGAYGSAGSAAGGAFGHYALGRGFAVLGGVGYAREDYDNAEIEDAVTAALAVRYVNGSGSWRPFAEAGGWFAPDANLTLSRTYANGAGTATGVGGTDGDLSYIYARAGLVVLALPGSEIAAYGEVGRLRLETDAYAEAFSSSNPFEAYVSESTDTAGLAKFGAQWSFQLSRSLDATLWGAVVHAFEHDSDFAAAVPGFGALTPLVDGEETWGEFGGRLGYKATERVTLDVFANGVSGTDVDTRVHVGGSARVRF